MATLPVGIELILRNYLNDVTSSIGNNNTPGTPLTANPVIQLQTIAVGPVTFISLTMGTPLAGYPLSVYKNSVLLNPETDYTLDSSGVIITFIVPLVAGTVIQVNYTKNQ